MTTLMNKEEEFAIDLEEQHKDDDDNVVTKDITTNVRDNYDDNFTGGNNNNDEEIGNKNLTTNTENVLLRNTTTNDKIHNSSNYSTNNKMMKPKFIKFKDHYTLTKPSSSVRYRGLNTSARVIEIGDQQVILEETYYPSISITTSTGTSTTISTDTPTNDFNESSNIDSVNNNNSLTNLNQSIRSTSKNQVNSTQLQSSSAYTEISIRRITSMTSGMQFLRVIYTCIALFLFGTIFILCLQYLLYTTLDILIEIGYTSIQGDLQREGKKSIIASLISLFSVIGLIYGLSTLLVISQAFVYDIWNGHVILSNFFTITTTTNANTNNTNSSNKKWFMISKLCVEWLYFIGFIGIPSITAIICLFLQKNNAWEKTAHSLIIVTVITFCFFALNILLYEVHACYIVLNNYFLDTTTSTDNNNTNSTKTIFGFFLSCVIFRQIRTYSGYKTITYIASGSLDNLAAGTGTSTASRSNGSTDNDNENKIESSRKIHSSIKIHTSIISKIVTWCSKLSSTTTTRATERCNCCVLYNTTEHRVLDMQDIVDVRSFITKYTWKLEAMFCRQSKQNKYIAILHGPGKVTQQQLRSSIICVGISPLLIIILVSAFIYYINFGISFTITIVCVGLLIVLPKFIETIRIYTSINHMIETKRIHKEKLINKLTSPVRQKIHHHTTKIDTNLLLSSSSTYLYADKNTTGSTNNNTTTNNNNEQGTLNGNVIDENDETDYNDNTIGIVNESEGFYRVHEVYRTCTPSKCFCYIMFTIEVLVTYLIPLIGLLRRSAYTLFIIFFIIVTIAGIRYYINVAIILEEAGHIDLLQQQQQPQSSQQNQTNVSSINTTNDATTTSNPCTALSEYEKWRRQSQLSSIIINVTRGVSLTRFATILSTIWLFLTILLFLALGESTKTSLSFSKFEYLYDFEYMPSNGIRYASCQITMNEQLIPLTTMADYIFVSTNAYRSNVDAQIEYDAWFNNGTAVIQSDIVTQWRADNNIVIAPVQFQLITFPNKGNFAVVNIRGTTNTYDLFADAQLWSASAFMQFLRFMLPAGRIWTPVIDELIWFITNIEGQTIEKVSFYTVTTQFVRFLQSQPEKYSGVAITGHSLGGGLAIISGAQTGTLAVAVSGPNAMLSRDTFNPPVSEEQLNQNTFNIIPDFDIIAHIDDPAENYQKIRCRDQSILNCHDSIRSLCEILYSCGSYGRPVMCSCVTDYGFPEPVPKNGTTRSFAEACGLT